MTAPRRTQEWTETEALARVLDLMALADCRQPAWRYVSCEQLRQAITGRTR